MLKAVFTHKRSIAVNCAWNPGRNKETAAVFTRKLIKVGLYAQNPDSNNGLAMIYYAQKKMKVCFTRKLLIGILSGQLPNARNL